MLKKDLEEELAILRRYLKMERGMTDPGINRILLRNGAKYLKYYNADVRYRCQYEFKGQKCGHTFSRRKGASAMNTNDALNVIEGVYYSETGGELTTYCPKCDHRQARADRIRIRDVTRDIKIGE